MPTKYSTVEEYLALQPANVRANLEKVRQIMKKAAPKAEEVISYKMPALKYHGMIAWYINRKDYCGIYVRPRVLDEFKKELEPYRKTKSALYIPYDKPLPKKLIAEIVKCAVKMNLEEYALKSKKTKK
jgi:uncharacterized protein YdhG (YjbR/CyaY superfamily)